MLIPSSEAIGDPKWQGSLLWAIVVSALIHGSLVWILYKTDFPNPDFEAFLLIIGGYGESDGSNLEAIRNVAANFGYVTGYIAATYVVAWILGFVARRIIDSGEWDIYFPLLRISDPWRYLFLGADQEVIPDLTIISATVQLGEKTFLYVGVLDHYQYFKDGRLNYLRLIGAQRRLIEDDKETDEDNVEGIPSAYSSDRFYELDGEYFILFCSEVQTLNIDYIYAQSIDEGFDEFEEIEIVEEQG